VTEVQHYPYSTSALPGGGQLAPELATFNCGKKRPGNHSTGG